MLGVVTGGECEASRGRLGGRRFWKGKQDLTVTEHVFHSEGVWFSCRSEATEGTRLAVLSEWRTSRVGLHGGQGTAHPSQDWGAEQFSKQGVHLGDQLPVSLTLAWKAWRKIELALGGRRAWQARKAGPEWE